MNCSAVITWTLFLSLQAPLAEAAAGAVEVDPYQALIRRIRTLENVDRVQALTETEHALATYPGAIAFWMKRCELLLELDQLQPAEACLDAAGGRFPQMSEDWRRVAAKLQDRLAGLRGPPADLAQEAAAPEPRPAVPGPRTRTWLLWTGVGVGLTGLGLGLVLGLVPRPHTTVAWPEGGSP